MIQILIKILKLSSLHLQRISRRAEPSKQGTSSVLIVNEKNERCMKKRIVITITHDEKVDHFHSPDDHIQCFLRGSSTDPIDIPLVCDIICQLKTTKSMYR